MLAIGDTGETASLARSRLGLWATGSRVGLDLLEGAPKETKFSLLMYKLFTKHERKPESVIEHF